MKKTVIIIIAIVLTAAAITEQYWSLQAELGKNQQLDTALKQKDYSSIYKMYVKEDVMVQERPAIGQKNAPLTFITVIDFESNESKVSYTEKIPSLSDQYVATGQARLYQKYYLLRTEYDEKKGRFIYAAAAVCLNTVNDTLALFDAQQDKLSAFIQQRGITAEQLTACGNSLYEDMFQTDTYRIMSPSLYIGIDGQDNTVLYGNPDWTTIGQRIKEKQIQLGI